MHIKLIWSSMNRGLLAILGVMVFSSLASVIYLTYTLSTLQNLVTQGRDAVETAFVLQDVLINLQNAQTSARGYIITGNKEFLEPYEEAMNRLPTDLKIIKSDQTLHLSSENRKEVDELVTRVMRAMEGILVMYDTVGFEETQQAVERGRGERLIQQVRDKVSRLSSTDLANIGPMQQRAIANADRARWVAGAMSLLVLGTCGAIIWYFRRTILHERALESTKSEFLSLASHQLRTPATNVKQYLGLLLEGYMGDISDKQKQALEIAYKNNEAEINIMNDLLNVAKLDLDRIQLQKKVTDIMKIARSVVRDNTTAAREAGQKLKLEGPKQIMATVDESYVKGVLENLLDNAIRYSKPDKKISVKVWREDDNVCIAVSDQGLGIRKRDYTKLFNKFSRLDNEFSASSQGSGLGLYWVKKVVSLHGGTIELVSREGKGSTFTVCLPIR